MSQNLLTWANGVEKRARHEEPVIGALLGGAGGVALGGLLPYLLTTKSSDDVDEGDYTKRRIRNAIIGAILGGGAGLVGGGVVGGLADPSVQNQIRDNLEEQELDAELNRRVGNIRRSWKEQALQYIPY